MIDTIYSFGDSWTTTSSILTSTGTYAGGKNWILKFKYELEKFQSHHLSPASYAALEGINGASRNEGICQATLIEMANQGPLNPTIDSRLSPEGHVKIKLYNYAESGDVLDKTLQRTWDDRGGIMQGQWAKFVKDMESEAAYKAGHTAQDGASGVEATNGEQNNACSDKRLFTVWIGINDICAEETDEDFECYLDKLFDSYKYFLMHDLYSLAEAGNIMLLALPPLHRTPTERRLCSTPSSTPAVAMPVSESRPPSQGFAHQVEEFNRRLEKMVGEVTNETIGVNLILINTYQIFTNVLDNPHRYGFIDGDNICTKSFPCDTREVVNPPRCHVWVDGYHPTREMQEIVGEEVFACYVHHMRRMGGKVG